MPRKYISRQGDTLDHIAFKHDGNTSNVANIKKANPRVTTPHQLPAGTVIIIPDIPGVTDRAKPPAAPLVGGDKDEVSIDLNGEQLARWQRVEIVRSMDAISSFRLTRPWNSESDEDRALFAPYQYQQVGVYIGGTKLFTGTVVKITPTGDEKQQSVTLAGYGLPGIIADCTPSPESYPLEWVNFDIAGVADELCAPFGLSISAAEPGNKFARASSELTTKIYPYLVKLAKQRGLLVADTPEGELLFQKAGTAGAQAALIGGQYPVSGQESITYDGQNRYSDVTALGDGWNSADVGVGGKGTASDATMPVARPIVLRMPDVETGNLKEAATAWLGRSIATVNSYSVPVTGWRDFDGNLWQPNTKVTYRSPQVMVYQDTEFIVRSVRYIRTPDALSAVLTLVYPEAYNGQVRSSWPWET